MSEDSKDMNIKAIKDRDILLDYNGIVPFKYSIKKTLGIGNDGLRELLLNFEKLQISFPNSKGNLRVHDIDCLVSLSPTDNPCCLLVNLRLIDGSNLKEKRWTFLSVDDANFFQRLVIAMNGFGPIIKNIFHILDRGGKGYIDVSDLDAAVAEHCPDNEEFTEGSTFLMIDECFTGSEQGKVPFGTLFALMTTADTFKVTGICGLLEEWLRVSSDRINTLFNFRDSRLLYNDFDSEIEFEDSELEELFRREMAVEPAAVAPDRTNSKKVKRMSIRSMRVHSTILGSGGPSIISRPRGSSCTTGSSITDLIGGELVLTTLQKVLYTLGPPSRDKVGFKTFSEGTLLLTSYRIVLSVERMKASDEDFRYGAPLAMPVLSVPLCCISRIELESDSGSNDGPFELAVVCKDFRVLRLAFEGNAVDTFPSFFRDVLSSLSFTSNQQDLFAFRAHKLSSVASSLAQEAAMQVLERSQRLDSKGSLGDSVPSVPQPSAVLSALEEEESDVIPRASSACSSPVNLPTTYTTVAPFASQYQLQPIERTQSTDAPVNHVPSFVSSAPARSYSTKQRSLGYEDGWSLFDPAIEYFRQGLLPHPLSYGNTSAPSKRGIISSHASCLTIPPAGPFWRLWSDNYQLVDTYPSAFILPSALTDREVFDAAMFRSRCRLPALTWREPRSGACLVRSSQPMSGISSQTNVADKLLLNLYRMRGNPHDPNEQKSPSTFYVIDCRSQLAANANAAFGKGVENWKALVNTRVHFCNIANIHTMRSSLENLQKVLMPWTPAKSNKTTTAIAVGGLQILSSIKRAFSGKEAADAGAGTPISGDGRAARTRNTSETLSRTPFLSTSSTAATSSTPDASQVNEDSRFLLSRIEDSGWLEHIRLVLAGSILVAEKLLLEGCGVLVHCSDGWDRTAQLSSTAQLILDPYYRTMKGFFVLIEKDWCGFGHKFLDRIGHGRSGLGEEVKETSPVFLQWLDVVSQIMYQFPSHFEFNEDLLVFIADSMYSCQFGTFLGNSEAERKNGLKVCSTTNSMWTYVLQPHVINKFLNPSFIPAANAGQSPSPSAGTSTPVPAAAAAAVAAPLPPPPPPSFLVSSGPTAVWPSTRRVKLWERYFCRWDLDLHPRANSGQAWKDDWV